MNELTNYGFNNLTKKDIVWKQVGKPNLRCVNGKTYECIAYCSDVVHILTVEELFDHLQNGKSSHNISLYDEVVMPTLNLEQQEEAVKSRCISEWRDKAPKHFDSVFYPPWNYDIKDCNITNPHTNKEMPIFSSNYYPTGHIFYSDEGTIKSFYLNPFTMNADTVAAKLGNEIGIIVKRYIIKEIIE